MKLFGLFRKKDIKKLSWKDITIEQFKKIKERIDAKTDDDTFLVWDLIGICYNMAPEEVDALPIRVAERYARGISFLNTEPCPTIAKRSYTINGKKYITTMDFSRITTAQYIDFQSVNGDADHPERVLAICLIPEGHKYGDGYSTDEVAKEIEKGMSITDAIGLSAFFLRLLQWSIRVAGRKMKRLLKKAKKEGKMSKEQMEIVEKIIRLSAYANGLNA